MKRELILQKQGQGRLYYRLAINYAPLNVPKALTCGFKVERFYEGVDYESDVVVLSSSNGDDDEEEGKLVYQIKAGKKVRVTLKMSNEAIRYHVALVDKLPAGFEALNPALRGTETVPDKNPQEAPLHGWWWRSTWWIHQNMRDERVEAFTTTLWPGVHEYSYIARATTLGTFYVPPAKAEEMYSSEVFGRSNSCVFLVA